MLMWKYGEHKAGLIIPCVISAVKSTPPMRAGTVKMHKNQQNYSSTVSGNAKDI